MGGHTYVVSSLLYLLLRQMRSCVRENVVRCLQVPCCADDLNQDSIECGIRLHSIPALPAGMSAAGYHSTVVTSKGSFPCVPLNLCWN